MNSDGIASESYVILYNIPLNPTWNRFNPDISNILGLKLCENPGNGNSWLMLKCGDPTTSLSGPLTWSHSTRSVPWQPQWITSPTPALSSPASQWKIRHPPTVRWTDGKNGVWWHKLSLVWFKDGQGWNGHVKSQEMENGIAMENCAFSLSFPSFKTSIYIHL